MPSYSPILETDGDGSVTVAGTAIGLTLPAALAAAKRQTAGVTGGRVTILVRTAPILYTLNGTAPTDQDASTGARLDIGDRLILTTFAEMDNLKMIRATATSGAVFCQYDRRVN